MVVNYHFAFLFIRKKNNNTLNYFVPFSREYNDTQNIKTCFCFSNTDFINFPVIYFPFSLYYTILNFPKFTLPLFLFIWHHSCHVFFALISSKSIYSKCYPLRSFPINSLYIYIYISIYFCCCLFFEPFQYTFPF